MSAPTITQPQFNSGTALKGGDLSVLYWLKADGTLALVNDTTPLPTTTTFGAGSAIIGNVRIDQTTPGTTNGVVVNANPSTTVATLTQATKTVAASGTPERLAAATTLCEIVLLEGKNARGTNNTGNVWVGTTSGNDTQLLMIAPGTTYELSAPAGKKIDLNLLYVDVATNADGVTYTLLN